MNGAPLRRSLLQTLSPGTHNQNINRQNSEGRVSKAKRATIILILACAVIAVLAMKTRQHPREIIPTPTGTSDNLPRLVDLGAGKCIPCKMMAPILEELKTTFAETFDVTFIDVWEHPKEAETYNTRIIPTQIFFNKEGKELFRHEGFFGKEEILAKWKELGVETLPATTEELE